MAYCRFSTDGFESDVYVWRQASGGFVIQVAAERRRWLIERPKVDATDPRFWEHTVATLRTTLHEDYTMEPIGGPYDGDLLYALNELHCLEVLADIAERGYRVPDSAITRLRHEFGQQLARDRS
jgi:hypothetical protein